MQGRTIGLQKPDLLSERLKTNKCCGLVKEFDILQDKYVVKYCDNKRVNPSINYCSIHFRMQLKKERGKLMRYEKGMSDALKDFVGGELDKDPDEQVSLKEELALMKHVCLQGVALYDMSAKVGTKEALAAGQILKQSLQDVANLTVLAQKVDLNASKHITAASLQFMIENVVKIMYDHLRPLGGAGIEIGQRIEEEMRKKINVEDLSGTTITPDRDVIDMDDSIPRLES